MDLSLLRRIGMTEGEIRVYSALVGLGKSSTGAIMQKANISSSKVYFILDKLVHKGLVSFVMQGKIKFYQTTDPNSLLNYIDTKEEEFKDTRKQLEKIIPIISSKLKVEEESAQVYKGMRGIKTAYEALLSTLNKGEEYLVFAIRTDESEDERVLDLFTQFHKKRVEKGVSLKVIADSSIEELYKKKHVLGKLYSIKHYSLTLPLGIAIGKDRVLSFVFGEDPTVYEIISSEVAKRYKEFFERLWKIAKQ